MMVLHFLKEQSCYKMTKLIFLSPGICLWSFLFVLRIVPAYAPLVFLSFPLNLPCYNCKLDCAKVALCVYFPQVTSFSSSGFHVCYCNNAGF